MSVCGRETLTIHAALVSTLTEAKLSTNKAVYQQSRATDLWTKTSINKQNVAIKSTDREDHLGLIFSFITCINIESRLDWKNLDSQEI